MSEYNHHPFAVSEDVEEIFQEQHLYENKVLTLLGEEPVMYSKFKKGVMQYCRKMGMFEPSAGDLVFQALFVWVIIGIVVRLICSAQEKGLVSGGNGELIKVDEKGIKIGENYVDIKSLLRNLEKNIGRVNKYEFNCIQNGPDLIVEAKDKKGKMTISHEFDENFMRGLYRILYKMAEKTKKEVKGGKKASKFRKHTKKSKSKRVKKSQKNNKSKKA